MRGIVSCSPRRRGTARFHATRLDVEHVASVMESLVAPRSGASASIGR